MFIFGMDIVFEYNDTGQLKSLNIL